MILSNYEQMLLAMQSLDPTTGPKMREPGNWYCSVPGEVGGNGVLTSCSGNGTTPQEAIEDAWNIIVNLPSDRYLRLRIDRNVRWNGFMFEDVSV